MNRKYDVVALGELLIDFTENGTSSQGNPIMEANPGGAPCNVLAMLNKLGHKTAFIGKVGDDMFGNRLEEVLKEVEIDTAGLVKDKEVHTTLAFVHTAPDGDRDFSFYRNPGADMMLTAGEVNEKLIEEAKVFHFGSLSMTDKLCEAATIKALDVAEKSGNLISFDPNLREPLWSGLDLAKEKIAYGLSRAHILKISDNEITWFTGKSDYDEAVDILKKSYPNLKLILVSLGREGSLAYSGDNRAFVKAVVRDDTIETTGAGDTFCGGVLHFVLLHGLREYSREELTDMLKFANAAASIVTTRRGALRVMPSIEEITALIK